MIKQLEQAISKLSELSESEQEKIAHMILITIERTKQSAKTSDNLNEMPESGMLDTTLLSESSLAKDWLTKEEDKAWENL